MKMQVSIVEAFSSTCMKISEYTHIQSEFEVIKFLAIK